MGWDLEYAKSRIRAFLEEVNRLKDSDFPYDDSREALFGIEALFARREALLASLSDRNDADVVRTACSESLALVFRFLPFLGFILRSTNVRNSFEVFGPLLRMAQLILGNGTRLVLSSEWEYSPHVYSQVTELPNVVFIGLPACESASPLLLPLAGHEFGHAVWQQRGFERKYSGEVKQQIVALAKRNPQQYKDVFDGEVNDLLFESNIATAHIWGLRQAEETFCDCLGIRLFAESYLHAFAYVLAPGLVDAWRVYEYPLMGQRIDNLVSAANRFDVSVPEGFESWFLESTADTSGRAQYLGELADRACVALVSKLIDDVAEIAESARVPSRSPERIGEALRMFTIPSPAAGIGDLSSLLNAAWIAYRDPSLWPVSVGKRRQATLFEVVLKSVEVLEIEARTIPK